MISGGFFLKDDIDIMLIEIVMLKNPGSNDEMILLRVEGGPLSKVQRLSHERDGLLSFLPIQFFTIQ